MTVEDYIQRMKEFGIEREALETGLPEFSRASVRATKVSAYLPDGFEKTKAPLKPAGLDEDLSALNSKGWHNAQKEGRRIGRPRKRKAA